MTGGLLTTFLSATAPHELWGAQIKSPALVTPGLKGIILNSPIVKPPEFPRQAPSAWKRAATETLCSLRAAFPACFARLDHRSRQPLKLKINPDIIAALPEIHRWYVGKALKLYTSHIGYIAQCVEGKRRIGLDGQPAGIVTAAEAAHAAELLAKRRKPRTGTPLSSPPSAQSTPSPRLTLATLKEAAKRKSVSGGTS